MACVICGRNDCNKINPAPGAGVTVTRLKEASNMAQITVSKRRYYLNADKTKVVMEGDAEAAYLLVGKGSPIAPEVAAHYNLETEIAESVSKVTERPEDAKSRMVTPGTSGTAENYAKMKLEHDVREAVNSGITSGDYPNSGRHGEMIAQGIINTQNLAAAEAEAAGAVAPAPFETPEREAKGDDIPNLDPNPAMASGSRTVEIPPQTPPPNDPNKGGDASTGQAPTDPAKGGNSPESENKE